MSDDLQSLSDFRGVVRLFPLPNLVLFPAVVQPLHVFEPRYRRMMTDALADDRLLAMALLRPGFEEDYENRPPLHEVACLGRIFNEERLADGRFNLLLHGLRRVRLLEELPPDQPYREARVQLLEDAPVSQAVEDRLRRELREAIPAVMQRHGAASQESLELFDSNLTLGNLCDVFVFALPLESAFKQQLLENLDVARRTHALLTHLSTLLADEPARHFPPDFSEN